MGCNYLPRGGDAAAAEPLRTERPYVFARTGQSQPFLSGLAINAQLDKHRNGSAHEKRHLRWLQPGYTLKVMPDALRSEPLPLEKGSDGVIRVGGTRVTLETIWAAFQDGATAEQIVQQYPSLSLADAYQAIGYCLRDRSLVGAYLTDRSGIREEIRSLNESRWSPEGVRARLLARRRH
jgi:hypothetical protein